MEGGTRFRCCQGAVCISSMAILVLCASKGRFIRLGEGVTTWKHRAGRRSCCARGKNGSLTPLPGANKRFIVYGDLMSYAVVVFVVL